ncbi:LysR substrate-binding domain-containing protein [Nocardiaceae bacterium NPDC056970]
MERRQLEYFLAVADQGSFTAAAVALHVAQPSLSQAIRALEREVGTALFQRLPRGVALTSAGNALLPAARQVVRDLQIARAAVQEVVGLVGGSLDIAMVPGLTLDPMSAVIGAFRRAHPQVQLAIAQPEEVSTVRDLVRTGEAELGFGDRSVAETGDLVVEPLGAHELMAAFPPGTRIDPGTPVDWDHLIGFGLIAGTPGTLVRDLVDAWAARRSRDAPQIAIELGRRETALYLVLAGAGAAALPAALARMAEQLGAVVTPIADADPRELAVFRRPGEASPAARAFLALIARTIRTSA